MIVCDTGPIVAWANKKDRHYFTANNLFRDLRGAHETIVLPATVLAEVCY
jgi:predicted nucleic acid-binding protein